MQYVASARSSRPRHEFKIWRASGSFAPFIHVTHASNIRSEKEAEDNHLQCPRGSSFSNLLCQSGDTTGHSGKGYGEPLWKISSSPAALISHATAIIQNDIYLFGGMASHGALNSLWKISYLTDSTWIRVDNTKDGFWPSPRFGHTLNSYRGKLIIFGGDTAAQHMDDLHIFCPETGKWDCEEEHLCVSDSVNSGRGERREEEQLRSLIPAGRTGHTALVHDNCLLVFGGWNGSQQLSDFWSCDLLCRKWVEISTDKASHIEEDPTQKFSISPDKSVRLPNGGDTTRGKTPEKRCWHIACVWRNCMYIQGGISGDQCFDDIWRYDFSSSYWECIKSSPPPFYAKRCRHAGFVIGNTWIVYGGRDEEGNIFSMPCEFSFDHKKWQLLTVTPSRSLHSQFLRSSMPNLRSLDRQQKDEPQTESGQNALKEDKSSGEVATMIGGKTRQRNPPVVKINENNIYKELSIINAELHQNNDNSHNETRSSTSLEEDSPSRRSLISSFSLPAFPFVMEDETKQSIGKSGQDDATGHPWKLDLWCQRYEWRRHFSAVFGQQGNILNSYIWLLPPLHGHQIVVDAKRRMAVLVGGSDDRNQPKDEVVVITWKSVAPALLRNLPLVSSPSPCEGRVVETSPLANLFAAHPHPFIDLITEFL